MIAIKLTGDELKAAVARMRSVPVEELAAVAGRGVANLVRQHLFDRDSSRANKLGGARTHFYADAARSVQAPVVSGELATIVINQVGLAQRWLGGVIKAGAGTSTASGGPTKYLTIPARAESYGKTAAEFTDLVFVPTRSGGALVQALQTVLVKGRKGGVGGQTVGGLVMFWLVKQVVQGPDPTVLPEEGAMEAAAASGVVELLRARGIGDA